MRSTDASSGAPGQRPGRRSVLLLGAGAATLGIAGCSLNNPYNGDPTPGAGATPDQSPDVALTVNVVAALLEVEARARQAAVAHPALARRFQSLLDLHAAHRQAIQDAVPADAGPTPAAPPRPPATRAAALTEQDAAERALRDRLVGFAARAESGRLARLLGSMAAGTSQQLAADPLVPRPR